MTTGRGGNPELAAGGPARHIPVLLEAVLTALRPADGGIFIDGTFGAGGYTRAILDAAATQVIAIDRDPAAIA
ncbi:MAG: 16S rRNA (cytosine(1402)-N(4))-methyltransferase, partial [Alphaproteobacteria bacterium]|nr:16S rRNA (cytosine(1402)-N(4))-methyltransferase [Alphaproteobacteria bacterium]